MSSKLLKLCACLSAIRGKHSCFVETRGASGTGKSYEDKLVLSCFDSSDIVQLNDATFASLFEREADAFNNKILLLGDLGNTQYNRLERVFNVLKILCTEHSYSRTLKRGKQTIEQQLNADALCVMYETTKRFVRDEQITTRTCMFSTKQTDDDLLDLFVEQQQTNTVENADEAFVVEYSAKIRKLMQFDIHVEHDFLASFASEVKELYCANKVRKLEQVVSLFESYVLLQHVDELQQLQHVQHVDDVVADVQLQHDVRVVDVQQQQLVVVASQSDYDSFVSLLYDCSFMSESVESDFVDMISSRLEKVCLDEVVEREFSEAAVDIDEHTVCSVLYRRFGLNSRSKLYENRDIFFTEHSLRKQFNRMSALKNAGDVAEMLDWLAKRSVLGILGNFRGSTVYYIAE